MARSVLLLVPGVVLVACELVVACSSFSGSDAVTGDAGGGDGAVGADGGSTQDASSGVDAAPKGCPGIHGPVMKLVGDECIDSTEVTQAEFGSMLTAAGAELPTLNAPCANTLPPSTSTLNCKDYAAGDNLPQTCITTCEAALFCEYAGKHLCSSRPGFASNAALSDKTSEWIYACALDGGRKPDPTCNVAPLKDAGAIRPVGQGCEGPSGVYDLIGNAMERTLMVKGDGTYYNGGDSYHFTTPGSGGNTCFSDDSDDRTLRFADIGFRCCAEPVK